MNLSDRCPEALRLACQWHGRQRRKLSSAPYVAHLLRVAGIVLENDGNEDETIAALLHDAIEDQGGAEARETIRRRFGQAVVQIVDQCSDTDQNPKPPWRRRKEAFVASLPRLTPSARLVTAADKLDNV
ncbi:MAG: HD domain-containing protein, partial [Pirellulales bacterium]|nr:HD domain-containing protein [Pirellulales bacterium]